MPREQITQPIYPQDEEDCADQQKLDAARHTMRTLLDWMVEPVVSRRSDIRDACRRAGLRAVVLYYIAYPEHPEFNRTLEDLASWFGITKQAASKLVAECREHFGQGVDGDGVVKPAAMHVQGVPPRSQGMLDLFKNG